MKILIFLPLLFIPVFGEHNSSLPKAICYRCSCIGFNPFTVDCDDMHWNNLPEFRKDMKSSWHFRIEGNSLKEITPFPRLENLTGISFRYNEISKIHDKAFLELPHLKMIDFSHNRLTEESLKPDIFRGPYAAKLMDPIPLEVLKLGFNDIKRIRGHIFIYASNLTSLDLSHNPLRDISKETAVALSSLRRLRQLDLSYTSLDRLPLHFFSELSNLVYLDLSGNHFQTVPLEVNYVPSLQHLSLDNNKFKVITSSDFKGHQLGHLTNLSLSNCSTLRRIENEAFGGMENLRRLYLKENSIEDIEPRAFLSDQNKTLDLSVLELQRNKLQSLPESALNWTQIAHLDLQHNPWKCTCRNTWIAKSLAPTLERQNYEMSLDLRCSYPSDLAGRRMVETKVQMAEFICEDQVGFDHFKGGLVALVVVGVLFLVSAAVLVVYVVGKRNKGANWIGGDVKYRRAVNEDTSVDC